MLANYRIFVFFFSNKRKKMLQISSYKTDQQQNEK